jgi:hypothetical protein
MKINANPPYDKEGSYQAAEVRWYRKHGNFQERIRIDGHGFPYVVGDQFWNCVRTTEYIERDMRKALGIVNYSYPFLSK